MKTNKICKKKRFEPATTQSRVQHFNYLTAPPLTTTIPATWLLLTVSWCFAWRQAQAEWSWSHGNTCCWWSQTGSTRGGQGRTSTAQRMTRTASHGMKCPWTHCHLQTRATGCLWADATSTHQTSRAQGALVERTEERGVIYISKNVHAECGILRLHLAVLEQMQVTLSLAVE